MKKSELIQQIKQKKSFLCIGLDPDLEKIPKHLLALEDPIFAFNKQIIDATHHLAVAYKPNTAFYESYGIKGWQSLEKTIDYLNENYPQLFTIADGKRGDIGNTASRYAQAFFQQMNFDALTVAPYMGRDSVEPFLEYPDKFAVLLALTSNSGASDFQMLADKNGQTLYEHILHKSLQYNHADRLMFVIGATQANAFQKIRKIVPHHFLLVPGIGAQGGNLEEVCRNGLNDDIGLLVNSSREILYAGSGHDFVTKAMQKALDLQHEMAKWVQ